MDLPGRNIATFSSAISTRLSTLRQRHFSLKNDMRRFRGMSMVGIERVWPVLPDVSMKKALVMKLPFE